MDKFFIQFDKCYLDSIKFVVNHDTREDLVLSLGLFLKQMATNLGGEIRMNQVNDSTPPEIPRATLVAKETLIHFGLNRVEVEIKGTRKHLKRDLIQDFYKNRINEAGSLLLNYLTRGEFTEGFAGIVAPVRFPQNIEYSKDYLLNELHRFCTGRTNSNLVTYSTKIGFRRNAKFENIEITDYEVKNVNVQAPLVTTAMTLNLDDFPTVEKGIMAVIDINNKPKATKFQFAVDNIKLAETFFATIESFEKNFK